jgi:hypothetical protein
MFQHPIVNKFHIYLLLLVVFIETSFLELDILHINIRNIFEWYGGSKDELEVICLETMTLEVGFLRKTIKLSYVSFGNNECGVVFHRDFLLDEVMKRWPDSN